MKKYGILFFILCATTVICILCAAHSFSLASVMPTFVDGALDTGVTVGGAKNLRLTVEMILYPVGAVLSVTLAAVCLFKAGASEPLCIAVREKIRTASPAALFLIISALITAVSLVYTCVFKQHIWDHHIFRFGEDMFMDFFNHIKYPEGAPQDVYYQTRHACFPPLAYIFYYGLSLLLPTDAIVNFDGTATSPYAIVIYVIYMAICSMLLYCIIRKLLREYGDTTSVLLFIALFATSAFLAVVERGNSVLIVLILLLFAMYLRDSQNAALREVALICIAFAAGLKIYPAVFGLLYIFEKRFKEAIRLLIYGMTAFFLPFVFFGGFGGLVQFFDNQLAIHNDAYESLTSIASSTRYAANLIFGDPFRLETLAKVLPLVFAVLCLVAFCRKSLAVWERVWLLVAVICFVPVWSGSYTAAYFVLPIVLFFKDTKDGFGTGARRVYNSVCTVLFAIAFSLIAFVTPSGMLVSEIRYIALYAVSLIIIFKAIIGFFTRQKQAA